MLHTAADDTSPDDFVWMPAHSRQADIGVEELSNGELRTAADVRFNAHADIAAKEAVELHRVPASIRTRLADHETVVREAAVWLGTITHRASAPDGWATRDSLASRANAGLPKPSGVRRAGLDRGPRAPWMGGHTPAPHGDGGVCRVCRRGAKRALTLSRFLRGRCRGSRAELWQRRARGEVHR